MLILFFSRIKGINKKRYVDIVKSKLDLETYTNFKNLQNRTINCEKFKFYTTTANTMRMITDFVARDTTLGKQFPLKLNNTVSNIEKFAHFHETKANTSIKKT